MPARPDLPHDPRWVHKTTPAARPSATVPAALPTPVQAQPQPQPDPTPPDARPTPRPTTTVLRAPALNTYAPTAARPLTPDHQDLQTWAAAPQTAITEAVLQEATPAATETPQEAVAAAEEAAPAAMAAPQEVAAPAAVEEAAPAAVEEVEEDANSKKSKYHSNDILRKGLSLPTKDSPLLLLQTT